MAAFNVHAFGISPAPISPPARGAHPTVILAWLEATAPRRLPPMRVRLEEDLARRKEWRSEDHGRERRPRLGAGPSL